MVKVSIIIPCRTVGEAFVCSEKCHQVDYNGLEVIVLPDNFAYLCKDNHKVIPTGKVLPSHKRDIGIKEATGEIIAFIDADAYPTKSWLKNAVWHLRNDKTIAGICGPGTLPPDSTMKQKAADFVLKLLPFNYRVQPKKARYVEDYPTFNLILWKKDILKAGGFNCDYLTGEDTLLCKRITKDLGKRILYAPDVEVYHERREVFKPFFKQIGTYGRHRGYFFKKHPETSRAFIYILPLILAIGVMIVCIYYMVSLVLF